MAALSAGVSLRVSCRNGGRRGGLLSIPALFSGRCRPGPACTEWSIATSASSTSGRRANLKRRLASWLRGGSRDAKGRALLSHTAAVEVTVTHTETEALLLENNLNQGAPAPLQHHPAGRQELPLDPPRGTDIGFLRFVFHRGARRRPERYFGPYSSAGAVRQTIGLIHKLFRVRQCTDAFFRNRSRPLPPVPDRSLQRSVRGAHRPRRTTPRTCAMPPCFSKAAAKR